MRKIPDTTVAYDFSLQALDNREKVEIQTEDVTWSLPPFVIDVKFRSCGLTASGATSSSHLPAARALPEIAFRGNAGKRLGLFVPHGYGHLRHP